MYKDSTELSLGWTQIFVSKKGFPVIMNNLDSGICVNIHEFFRCVLISSKKGHKLHTCDINRTCYPEHE